MHHNGKILILWDPLKADVMVIESAIDCIITRKVTLYPFKLVLYIFSTIVARRSLWNNIMEHGTSCPLPWMIMGDFNNVLKFGEKCNKAYVTPYKIRDCENCFLNVGLTDMKSIRFFTWGPTLRFGEKLIQPWLKMCGCTWEFKVLLNFYLRDVS